MANPLRAMGAAMGIHSGDQLAELVSSRSHALPIARHRAALIQGRVYLFAVAFAVLVPVWSVLDALFLPHALWMWLSWSRAAAATAFMVVAWQTSREATPWRARLLLAALLAITPLFYLASTHWMRAEDLTGAAAIVAQLYGLLPFVIVAGLALFPLTLEEFHAYALPMLLVTLLSVRFSPPSALPHAISTLWLLGLLLGVAMLSSLGQLRYMLAQVSRASRDPLTGALTRRAGIDVLDLQFRLATLHGASLSLLFFDLDQFKAVNDGWGHNAGDQVLKAASQQLGNLVRKGDSVIRWGGEEFIVVLPTADGKEANQVIERIMRGGLGLRPDGRPVTASIGVAELPTDDPKDWKAMLELADQRMYQAKTGGRARAVGIDGATQAWVTA